MTPETFIHLQGNIGDKTSPPGGRLTDTKLEEHLEFFLMTEQQIWQTLPVSLHLLCLE